MELFFVLKFVHVTAAVVWLGGGFAFAMLGSMFERRGDMRSGVAAVTLAAELGPVVFMPASILTLISGALLLVLGAMPWTAWSVLALPLVGAAFSLGAGVVKPTSERIAVLLAAGHEGVAIDMTRRILRVARLESAIMAAIMALMVVQPGWSDLGVLAPIGALVALAAITFLLRRRPAAI